MAIAGRWFRFYDSVVDDPKVQRLPDAAFRAWVNLMCVASKNDGRFSTDLKDISFALRVTESRARDLLQVLQSAGLIERFETGWEPHNWSTRQYDSDSSAERMRRHRSKKVTEDVTPVTEEVTANVTSHVQKSDAAEKIQIQSRTEKKKEVVAPLALPDWLPLETWAEFLQSRKKNSPNASKLLIAALARFRAAGDDPKTVLEQSIMSNWKGLFPLKKTNGNGHGQRRESQHEQRARIIAEDHAAEAQHREPSANQGEDHRLGVVLPYLANDRR